MTSDELTVLIAIVVGAPIVVIAVILFAAVRSPRARAARALAATPRSSVAEAQDGALVKLIGRAQAHGPLLRARLSEQKCVAEELTVGFHDPMDEGHRQPATFPRATDFAVEDESGSATVSPGALRLLLDRDETRRVPTTEAAGWMFDLLEKSGLTLVREPPSPGVFELHEARIEEGDLIAVLGRAHRGQDGALTLKPDAEAGLTITDEREPAS